MTGSIHITDMSASDALRRYAGAEALRGKGMHETARKVMRFWVSFATKKIPAGNREKIGSSMRSIVSSYSQIGTRRGKAADAWRGTLAARLVAMIDWRGARRLKGAAFYAKVRQFAARRAFAANLHRAGMRPAFLALRGKMSEVGRLPQFQSQPGQINERLTEAVSDILVENWARGGGRKAQGVTGTLDGQYVGDAFERAFPEAERLFLGYYQDDMRRAAERAGLTVDP